MLTAASLALAGCGGRSGGPEAPADHDLPIHFVDATQEAGLGGFRHDTGADGRKLFPESMGSGCGFVDYDGDGWLDVLLVGGGSWDPKNRVVPLRLYRNKGDGTFEEATAAAGLEGVQAYGLGVAVADYDNDGDEDIYLTTLAENMLFRNDGGVFTEVGQAAGVAGAPAWSSSAAFFDADRDGWLDLYVGNYVEWSEETDMFCTLDGKNKDYCTPEVHTGVPGRYYHNNGNGTFTDRTRETGLLDSPGKSLGVMELDFNRDDWPDLMVTNDTQPNVLFENNGDGTFTEVGKLSGMAYDENGKARAGMGVDAGVVDTTGQVTLFVANFSKEMISVYRYAGNRLFEDRAATSQIGRASLMTLKFALFLIDVDLDTDLDLFVLNGHVQPQIETTAQGIGYDEPPHLFLNDGNGVFEDVAPRLGGVMQQRMVGRAAAYGDYDRDGDVDLLLAENAGPAHLWRNESVGGGGAVRVHATGTRSNRDALGARIVGVVGGRRMERMVRSGTSYLAANELPVTFGLGEAAALDSLYVYWPSGEVGRYGPLEAGHEVYVTEGEPRLRTEPFRKAPPRRDS